MKKAIQFCLLTAAVLMLTTAPSKAQDAAKDLAALVKKFETAYNNKDEKTLKTMYTEDAVRVNPDGGTATGAEAIVAELKDDFVGGKLTISIKQDTVEPKADGSATATGSYHVTGTTNTGSVVDFEGGYTNTCVKVKGQWKIAKSVLANK